MGVRPSWCGPHPGRILNDLTNLLKDLSAQLRRFFRMGIETLGELGGI
jgi:hypothetical protein